MSARVAERLLSAGELPEPIRLGRVRVWPVADLQLFVQCGGSMPVFRARKALRK